MVLKVSTSYTHAHILFAIYDQTSLPSIGFSRYKLEDRFSWRPSVPFLSNVASKPIHRLRSLLVPPLWATEHVYHANKLDLILLGATSELVHCIFQFRWALPTRNVIACDRKCTGAMHVRTNRGFPHGPKTTNMAFSQIWKWNSKFWYISFSLFLPFFTCI